VSELCLPEVPSRSHPGPMPGSWLSSSASGAARGIRWRQYLSVVGYLRPCVTFGSVPIVFYPRADCPAVKEAEAAVPDEDKKRAAHRALVDRVLKGEGSAAAEQRARAFAGDGLSPPLDALIGKVAERPAQITEADFAAAKASGCTEDQLFELVICAAVGQSARLYEAGLQALADATVRGTGHAT
jgi:hypothetical protein